MMRESTSGDLFVATNLKRNSAIKKVLKFMGTCVIVLLALLGLGVAYLAYPGTPTGSKFMTFEGYIGLPKGGCSMFSTI